MPTETNAETALASADKARAADRRLRKVAKHLNNAYAFCFRVVCFVGLLIGLYILYDTVYVFYNAKADRVAAYRPRNESMEEVQAVAADAVAWITVDGTSIDYPIMQGATNSEYLNKDPFGNYSLAGSIFLDSRNQADFSDPYSMVYGHHMSGGYMFGALDDFEEKPFFDDHRFGELILEGESHEIHFFAFLITNAETKEIFWPTEADFPDAYIRENAQIFYEPDNDHYIALSTCRNPETVDRAVVIGCILDD